MLNRLILDSVVHFMGVHLSVVDWPFGFFFWLILCSSLFFSLFHFLNFV